MNHENSVRLCILKVLEQRQIDRDTALLEGGVVNDQVSTDFSLYSPILVIVPPR